MSVDKLVLPAEAAAKLRKVKFDNCVRFAEQELDADLREFMAANPEFKGDFFMNVQILRLLRRVAESLEKKG